MKAAVARHTCDLLLIVLLGGLLGATLVRVAPGFSVDERELDPRLHERTIQSIRNARTAQGNVVKFYGAYLAGLLRFDLGVSPSFKRPVADLLAERLPLTIQAVSQGLISGWLIALVLAVAAVMWRVPAMNIFSTAAAGLFLSVPAALIAVLMVYVGGGISIAIGMVVFPKVFSYTKNVLLQAYASTHVINAKARGLSESRILLFHIAPAAVPELAALIGVSVSLALGASIPMEAISDQPGIGHLAWQAAHSRDLPLLVNLTLLIALITRLANALCDLGALALTRRQP
jgi:peptide/nickel transport system permease protein